MSQYDGDDRLIVATEGSPFYQSLNCAEQAKAAADPDFVAFPKLLDGENVLPDVTLAPNDPLSIIYTGGSTSMPKGVLAPHTGSP